jgi:hypothetical protein
MKTRDENQPIFDDDGRMTYFNSAVKIPFSLDELLQQYRGLQLSGTDEVTDKQRNMLEVYKERVTKDGKVTVRSNKEDAGRTLRSDHKQLDNRMPLPAHKMRDALQASSAATSIESDMIEPDVICLPTTDTDSPNSENPSIPKVSVDDTDESMETFYFQQLICFKASLRPSQLKFPHSILMSTWRSGETLKTVVRHEFSLQLIKRRQLDRMIFF